MDEPKVAVLRHYASPYYDPQKAHEYYMRTRELKGRSTTSLNDEGKKIWSYTKNNIKSEKAAKVKEEQEKRDQKITELREKAEATKEQISSRLKELNEALTQNASDKRKSIDTDKDSDLEEIEKESSSEKERIDNKKDAEIERLMAIEIPSGLSKAERSKRVAERTAKIAKLRNDAKSDKAKISSDAKTDKASIRTDATNKKAKVSSDTKEEKTENKANAKSERAKVSSELKAAVKSVIKRQKPISIHHMNKRIRTNLIRFSQSIRKSRNQRKSLPVHQRRHRIRYHTISENKGGKSK